MGQRKSSAERRAEIIEATLDLASEIGPDRVTTDAIAQRIGISQAAIFRHFPRKSHIWAAVVGWLNERVALRWAEILAQQQPPVVRLRALLVGQFDFIQSVPALPAIVLSRELQADGGIVKQAIMGIMGSFRRALACVIADGQKAGEIRSGLDPDQAAFALIALVQGTALRWVMVDYAFDLAAEGEVVVDIALNGLIVGKA